MPPTTLSAPLPGWPQGAKYFHQRLTKLYSDAKQSYETAKVAPSPTNVAEDPELAGIRRDFQIQQDRLLAWGYYWTDTTTAEAQHPLGGDVEIDKKLDLAGYGDVVANVLSEIQRMLDESSRLQHPDKHLRGRKEGKGAHARTPSTKEWTHHEVTTSKALLAQLTMCIDDLYSLSQSRRTQGGSEKRRRNVSSTSLDCSSAEPETNADPADVSQPPQMRQEAHEPLLELLMELKEDPLYIDYSFLTLHVDPVHDSLPPPPYSENDYIPQRVFASLGSVKTSVLVDFTSTRLISKPIGEVVDRDRLRRYKEIIELLSANSTWSHNSHTRLIGFTLDFGNSRFGLIYQMPAMFEVGLSGQQESLSSFLKEGHDYSNSKSRTLESRFRLSYHTTLAVLGYLTGGITHHHINSGNILFVTRYDKKRDSRIEQGIRYPYLLFPSQGILVDPHVKEAFYASIYRHPEDDESNTTACIPSHEIYSLGLLLLEIGLWMPLAKLWKTKYSRKSFMTKVKQTYVQNLASKCGSRYMHAVQRCLEAPLLLPKSAEVDAFHKSVEFLLGVATELSKCCMIDEGGPPPESDLSYVRGTMSNPVDETSRSDKMADPDLPKTPKSMSETNSTRAKDESAQPAVVQANQSEKLRKWPGIDIPQTDLDQWNAVVMPKLSKLLKETLHDSPEPCSCGLMMIGTSPDTAKTTICIQCANPAMLRDVLKQRFRLKRGWGLVILKGEVRRSGNRRATKRRRQRPSQTASSGKTKLREQHYQERPECGASIGAFKDNKHLPPVSFGGTILVDGEPYGMTVHHMLDDTSDDEDERGESIPRSSAPRATSPELQERPEDLQFMSVGENLSPNFAELEISEDEESDSDASTIRPDYSVFDEDGNELWFIDDVPPEAPELEDDLDDDDSDVSSGSEGEADDDDTASIGDKPGVDPLDGDLLHVTQPALDDVDEDFFPSLEDRDDDHLASHALGYVHASSGIRRVISHNMKHEVDWALIKIQEKRLQISNAIRPDVPRQGKSLRHRAGRCPETDSKLNPRTLRGVAPSSKLGGMEVHCCGRSSGFRRGRISQAMSLVKMHGRQSFSSSWCVEGGFGGMFSPISPNCGGGTDDPHLVPGDSGAWIYNPTTGQLCGHVLAWGTSSKTAYIAPMEVLFEDIKEKLDAARVCLPNESEPVIDPVPVSHDASTITNAQSQPSTAQQQARTPDEVAGAKEIEATLRTIVIDEGVLGRKSTGVSIGARVSKDLSLSGTDSVAKLRQNVAKAVM